MTVAGSPGAAAQPTTPTPLEIEARARAEAQRDLQRAPSAVRAPLELVSSPIARALERARKYLASSQSENAALQKPAEWFLDNYYLIRRVARQVAEELPSGFLRRLPRIASGPAKGVARIDALARALFVRCSVEIGVTALLAFVHAY